MSHVSPKLEVNATLKDLSRIVLKAEGEKTMEQSDFKFAHVTIDRICSRNTSYVELKCLTQI